MMPDYFFHFGVGSEHKWHTLMQKFRNNIHNRVFAIRRAATGLFNKEGNRRSLINEPQPALTVTRAPISGIEKHTAASENPPAVSDQRAKPAHIEITPTRPLGTGDTISDIGSSRCMPKSGVGRIDGKFGRLRRNADSPVQQMKHTGGIHLEGMNTLSHGQQ